METKTKQVKNYLLKKEYSKALSIAKTFKLWPHQEMRKQIVRGWECYKNPEFYKALGYNPKQETQAAINQLLQFYQI